MSAGILEKVQVRNFRSLANVELALRPINVFFGPNGAGKTTLLDSLYFVSDCVNRNVEEALAVRNQGVGLRCINAEPHQPISIALETREIEYRIDLVTISGMISSFSGEYLFQKDPGCVITSRKAGEYEIQTQLQAVAPGTPIASLAPLTTLNLVDPKQVSLIQPSTATLSPPVFPFRLLIKSLQFHSAHSMNITTLRERGSKSSVKKELNEDCENLFSVLRNLSAFPYDGRFRTIMRFMKEALPSFDDLIITQTSSVTVYASFLERGRREPIESLWVSDGHLHILALLTLLFSREADEASLILLDEPETSLHPWALAVLAKAVKEATTNWNRQVFIATHSPVLISQFEPDDILAAEQDAEGRTTMTRVSEMADVKDLLTQYAAGSLYMAETLAPQSKLSLDGPEG